MGRSLEQLLKTAVYLSQEITQYLQENDWDVENDVYAAAISSHETFITLAKVYRDSKGETEDGN